MVDQLQAKECPHVSYHPGCYYCREDRAEADRQAELAILRENLARVREVLASLEWSAGQGQLSSGRCPCCRRLRPEGHRDDCRLAGEL